MSAPDTNIEKQKERHKPALFGMGAAVAWSVGLLILFVAWIVWQGGEPVGADAQVDGRTGEIEAVEETVSN